MQEFASHEKIQIPQTLPFFLFFRRFISGDLSKIHCESEKLRSAPLKKPFLLVFGKNMAIVSRK